MSSATLLRSELEASLALRIPAALTPKVRQAPELVSSGIRELDAMLGGGIARAAITEISGPASSGRTAIALSFLAGVTRNGGAAAWIDAHDTFHPESAAACGIDLEYLLWVRASPHLSPPNKARRSSILSRLEQSLKATDLLLQSGGFSTLVLDISDVPPEHALRVPLATWFRFRAAVEQCAASFLLLTQTPCAKSSASLVLRCQPREALPWDAGDESPLFQQLPCSASLEKSRQQTIDPAARKHPASCSHAEWSSRPPWAR